jgi:hypothetical protein
MKRLFQVLGPTQQRVLKQLGPHMAARGFYLAGGTAVALQHGHRRSADLDWFSTEPLREPLQMAQQLRDDGLRFVTQRVAPDTLEGSIGTVRATFLAYRYPLLQPLVNLKACQCQLASRADLAAMKLSAIAQRGAKKDFIDLYALMKRAGHLSPALEWYQQKFHVKDMAHLLFSLSYFDDADRERTPPLLWKLNWRAIKRAFSSWIKELYPPPA